MTHSYAHALPFWYPPILAYHRIDPIPGTDTPTISPEIFAQQMRILKQRWQPIAVSDFVLSLEKGTPMGNRAVVVTFDDGTEDAFTCAYPILKKYEIPAAVFMVTANIGQPGSLHPEQIRQMHRGGITFGSHTIHHAYLPSLSEEKIHHEVRESKQSLEDLLGTPVEFLSYPAGGFTQAIANKAREVGYRAAFTTNRGIRRFPIDRWAVRRITIHKTASRFGMWLRCSGYYQINKRLRPPS